MGVPFKTQDKLLMKSIINHATLPDIDNNFLIYISHFKILNKVLL